jgi:hypothetical protein
LADGTLQGRAIIADSWYEQNPHALKREQKTKIRPIACIRAIDTMRGCTMTLTAVANAGAPPCPIPEEFACSEEFMMQTGTPGPLRTCD